LKYKLALFVAILGLPMAVATSVALAEAAETEAFTSDRPFTEFAKGTWTIQTYGGYLNDFGPQDQEGGFATAGASYYFVDNMSLGLELVGYGISQPGPEAFAGGPQLAFRHHIINGRDWSFFFDVTAAFAEANERVPSGGTRFNFIEQAGMGLTYDLRGNSHLLLGVRYLHLSNAQMEGADRNPSINGISAYVGLMFTL
jgi:hypothetical protein